MKVAVLIMSTLQEPSVRNIKAMKDTFVSSTITGMMNGDIKNAYDFYFYSADNTINNEIEVQTESEHIYNVYIQTEETVYKTYEKTFLTYNRFKAGEYAWFVRINISCFLNIKLLDAVISKLDKDIVYCNALNSYVNVESGYVNDIYPRGDFYMISDKVRKGIIENGKDLLNCDTALKNRLDIPHVDDTLTGIALIRYFGPNYYKHYKMLYYNFIPTKDINLNNINFKAIASRVKTVPDGLNSGYSWDDNEYRVYDQVKMKELNSLYNNTNYNYTNINETDIIVDFEHSRPTIFVQTSSQPIVFFSEYFKYKNKS